MIEREGDRKATKRSKALPNNINHKLMIVTKLNTINENYDSFVQGRVCYACLKKMIKSVSQRSFKVNISTHFEGKMSAKTIKTDSIH